MACPCHRLGGGAGRAVCVRQWVRVCERMFVLCEAVYECGMSGSVWYVRQCVMCMRQCVVCDIVCVVCEAMCKVCEAVCAVCDVACVR